MSACKLNTKTLAILGKLFLDVKPLAKGALAIPNLFPIGINLICKIGRSHQLRITEHISINKGLLAEHTISESKNLVANIIDNGALNVIGGLSVNHEDGGVNVNH
jgi:hypothetical protein